MYYIINQTDQIIAADTSLLELLHIENIDELTKQVILGDIRITSLSPESIHLTTPHDTLTYTIETSTLSSMLGNLRLVHLLHATEKEAEEVVENDISSLTLPENEITFTSPIEEEEKPVEETFESPVTEIDDLISIKDSISISDEPLVSPRETEDFSLLDTTLEEEPFTLPETKEIAENETLDNELFDLTIPNTPEETIDEISLNDVETLDIEPPIIIDDAPIVQDTTPIIIYIDEVSESIGISDEDYNTFLNEYIDTAISLEANLQSPNQETRSSAIGTLTQLADVLELPAVNEIISQLDTASPEKGKDIIESFYGTLSRLTTQKKNVTTMKTFVPKELSVEEENIHLNTPTESNKSESGFGTINLEGVDPIHFDFQLEEAANDLSLPVELIEEFVHDFIEQAHIETEKMLVAYEKGDLDTIQKIGHLLKGASSNLRINPLSDTLYEIQFCEDSSNLDTLIKRYWGQFLAFEQQIDVLSK